MYRYNYMSKYTYFISLFVFEYNLLDIQLYLLISVVDCI